MTIATVQDAEPLLVLSRSEEGEFTQLFMLRNKGRL